MVNIPMTPKPAMRTSDLSRINQTGKKQTLQTLLQNRSASAPAPKPAPAPRPAPAPAPKPAPRPAPAPAPKPAPRPAPAPAPRPAPAPAPRPAPAPKNRPPASGLTVQKGQKTSLSQFNQRLDLIEVGLGWDLGPGGRGYDLDVEAFLLGASGKVLGDDWFVFYNQPVSPDGAVRLLGDNTTGAGAGDDEVIQLRLSRVDARVNRIAFIVTINEARERGYNFSHVANAYVRIVDRSTGRELIRFRLTDYYASVCSMVVGEVYRYKDEWRFNPVGNGTADDLAGLCVRYGVNV